MNPLLQEALGSVIRWLLMILAGYIVHAGIWTANAAEVYVAAATVAVLALLWSLWQKYRSRLKLVVALSSSVPQTENAVKLTIANTPSPSVTTASNIVPVVPEKPVDATA